MRLLKQIIEKKMDNERFLNRSSQDLFSYLEHLSAYLLSLFYLGRQDVNIRKKEKLWNSYLRTQNKKFLFKLSSYKSEEEYVIMEALKKMDISKEEESEKWGSLFGEFTWMILSYEHEETG